MVQTHVVGGGWVLDRRRGSKDTVWSWCEEWNLPCRQVCYDGCGVSSVDGGTRIAGVDEIEMGRDTEPVGKTSTLLVPGPPIQETTSSVSPVVEPGDTWT